MLGTFLDGRVTVKVGDLTQEATDAIVNAANSSLLGGGGVDGAIHHAGGPAIVEECKRIRETAFPEGLPTGEAVITTAGRMPSRWVIHTVGPVFGRNQGRDAELLAACYVNSLSLAAENSLSSIAFPSISTGVYSYPRDEAARVVSSALGQWLDGDSSVGDIRLVFYSRGDADIFLSNCSF